MDEAFKVSSIHKKRLTAFYMLKLNQALKGYIGLFFNGPKSSMG